MLPTRVIAEPISGINRAITQFITTNVNVTIIFVFILRRYPSKNSSSIESLLGNITSGKLEITEISRAKFETSIKFID